MENKKMSNENEMKYFCIGLGLGVAAGFLFAPKAGSEAREYVQAKALEGVDFLKNEAANVIHAASDAVERSSKTIRHQKENVVAAVQAGKAAFDEAAAATPAL